MQHSINCDFAGNPMWDGEECTYCGVFQEDYMEDTPKVQYAEGLTFVNVYEVDRIYGGPEEGGWYYDAGQLITSRQVPVDQAESVRDALEREYPKGTGRNASWSVCYSGGDYRVWIESAPGADYPAETPHYE